MKTENVRINGVSLETILKQYNAIPALIYEVQKLNGSFERFDEIRSCHIKEAVIEIEYLII